MPPGKFRRFLKFIHYWYRGCKSTPCIQVKLYWINYWSLFYFNDLFDQFECTYEVLTVPARRWRPVMRRPVMLTDLIKQNTILSYDRSWSPDKLINLINQIDQFECTYKVLTVPARRWRPVMRRLVMLTDLMKQYTIFSYDRSRSPDK